MPALPMRQALAQARLAGRQARNEAIAARMAEAGPSPVKPPRPAERTKPLVEHRLTVDGLVTLSRATIGFRVGATVDPYVPLQKGAVGVLVARNIWARRSPKRRMELCHVMLPAGIMEIPVSMVRDCGGGDDEA